MYRSRAAGAIVTEAILNDTSLSTSAWAEKLPANATVTEKGITTGASCRPGREMPYRGPGKKLEIAVAEDPTATTYWSFVECLRTGAKPIADVHVGLGSALEVIVGNESIKEKRELKISSAV
jgi:hypothetical protein